IDGGKRGARGGGRDRYSPSLYHGQGPAGQSGSGPEKRLGVQDRVDEGGRSRETKQSGTRFFKRAPPSLNCTTEWSLHGSVILAIGALRRGGTARIAFVRELLDDRLGLGQVLLDR